MNKLKNIRTVRALSEQLQQNQELMDNFKEDPVAVVDKLSGYPQLPDTRIYRLVVLTLGVALTLSIIGAIGLAMREGGAEIPDLLITVSAGAIGALAGILVPQFSEDSH